MVDSDKVQEMSSTSVVDSVEPLEKVVPIEPSKKLDPVEPSNQIDSIEKEDAKKTTTPHKRHPGFGPTPEGMSRNQFKKMKKAELREQTHAEWRAKVREKEKEKKKAKKQAMREGDVPPPPKKEKIEQIPSNLRVALDMSFDSLMLQKEVCSVARQIQRCYADNRRAKHPVNLFVTNHTERIKDWFDTKAKECGSWKRIAFESKPYEELFPKEDLVYLTADSDNVIETLDENKVYIIGGIVDKNRHKLLTLKKAQSQGIATAQLPIGEYMKLVTRKVLAVNHVFDILVRFLEYKDWERAFQEVIPQRKINQAPGSKQNTEDEASDDDDDTPA